MIMCFMKCCSNKIVLSREKSALVCEFCGILDRATIRSEETVDSGSGDRLRIGRPIQSQDSCLWIRRPIQRTLDRAPDSESVESLDRLQHIYCNSF